MAVDVEAKLSAVRVKALARESGFGLVGVADAAEHPDWGRYRDWVAEGFAGEMGYLTDYRAERRRQPQQLLPAARTVICLGLLYNGPEPRSTEFDEPGRAWISRYAWGLDYHEVVRAKLQALLANLLAIEAFEYKICSDTAPLLERSYAQDAGLGWIGKNTCLIDQASGSWYFLAEILTSLQLERDQVVPFRCGTCTRCIDACPTQALTPGNLDSRRCISYLTIEARGSVPEELRPLMGNHVFGCDICQDVCPWNRRAPVNRDDTFAPREFAPPLEKLAALSESEFRRMFQGTPVQRARYRGFLRNVCIAMGNQPRAEYRAHLERLAASGDAMIAEHAEWALRRFSETAGIH